MVLANILQAVFGVFDMSTALKILIKRVNSYKHCRNDANYIGSIEFEEP